MNKTLLLAGVAACLFAANANAVELNQYVSGKLTYSDASHDVNGITKMVKLENRNSAIMFWVVVLLMVLKLVQLELNLN